MERCQKMTNNQKTPEEELLNQGWQTRSILDEPRLSEMIRVYEEIGYEVHLEPFFANQNADCSECMKSPLIQCKTIYTRKMKPEG